MRLSTVLLRGVALSLLLTNSTFATPTRTQLQNDLDNLVGTGKSLSGANLNALLAKFLQQICGSAPGSAFCVTPTSPSDPRYGAKCDGIVSSGAGTDDTIAFKAAIVDSLNVALSPGQVCLVSNLVVADHSTLDCKGAILMPAPGAAWILKKTGNNSRVRDCELYDPLSTTMKATTTSAPVSAGATTIPVVNASAMQVNMIADIQLSSGAWFASKITQINALANTITIADPIPASVATAVAGAAGTNYNTNGAEVTILGGLGPPATGHITTSGGNVSAFTLDAPGLYSTPPSSPAFIFDPTDRFASGATVSLTFGASAVLTNAAVEAAFGVYTVDNASAGRSDNIYIPQAPVGFQIMNSSALSYNGAAETVSGIRGNASKIVGMAKFVNVNNTEFFDINMYGYNNGLSQYGTTGLYIDGTSPIVASGGNKFTDVNFLNFETGASDINGSLDRFVSIITDTNRNYGFNCIGCNSNYWQFLETTFTGPNAKSNIGGQGGGMYFGSAAVNNTVLGANTASNAYDIWFGDQTSTVWANPTTWAWSKIVGGFAGDLQPGNKFYEAQSLNIAGVASPIYAGVGFSTTTDGASIINNYRGSISSLAINASVAPGAATFSVFLRVNFWNGSTYAGWQTTNGPVCVWTGSANLCTASGQAVGLNPLDKFDFLITTSAGTFPANELFSIVANGI